MFETQYKERAMELLKRVGMIGISSIDEFAVDDEFIAGKNKIGYVDVSFENRFAGRIVKSQKRAKLVCDKLQKYATSCEIIAAMGGIGKEQVTLADILAALRSDRLEKGIRHIFFVEDRAIRIDWLRNGWCIHAFSVGATGGWVTGRQVVSCDLSND